jgi:tetracycline repressor-like protein
MTTRDGGGAARRMRVERGIYRQANVGFGCFYNPLRKQGSDHRGRPRRHRRRPGRRDRRAHGCARGCRRDHLAAHRSFVRRARSDPDWAWLLVRLDVSHNVLRAALGPYARRDLRNGIKAGRLNVPHEGVALFAAGGALLAVMRAVLDGAAGKDADHPSRRRRAPTARPPGRRGRTDRPPPAPRGLTGWSARAPKASSKPSPASRATSAPLGSALDRGIRPGAAAFA